MIWLATFFVANLAYKLYVEPAYAAVVSSALLVPLLYVCWKYGGWSAPKAAARWLADHKQSGMPVGVPVIGGPAIVLVLALYSGKHTMFPAVMEALWLYFFFHGCMAVGIEVMRRVRHRLKGPDLD